MMFCPQCGQVVKESARFCEACGQALPATAQGASFPEPRDASTENEQTSDQMPPAALPPLPAMPYSPPPRSQQAYPAAGVPQGQQQPHAVYTPPVSPISQPYGYSSGHAPYAPPQMLLCRICGAATPYGSALCVRCGAPVGAIANPNDPTATSYLMVGGQPQTESVNTSGNSGPVPIPFEIQQMGWSWGAFGTNFIWLFAHGMVWWGVALIFLHLFPLFALIGAFYIGVNGNRLAWQHRRYQGVEHFKRTESVWTGWGLFGFGLYLLVTGLYIVWFVRSLS